MLDGLRDLVSAVEREQEDWFKSAFFAWSLNSLLNVKHEIERTGEPRLPFLYPYGVHFEPSERRVCLPVEFPFEAFYDRGRILKTVTLWLNQIMATAVFRQLTHDCILEYGRDGSIVANFSQRDCEKASKMPPEDRRAFLLKRAEPFAWSTDEFRLEIEPLQYPASMKARGNAAYLFSVYPYFLSCIDFSWVPRAKWTRAERDSWDAKWSEVLTPLDFGAVTNWKAMTWSTKFLVQIEAADALEMSMKARRQVLEEWHEEHKATGKQYAEVPYRDDLDNERLLRKVVGLAYRAIGDEMAGETSSEVTPCRPSSPPEAQGETEGPAATSLETLAPIEPRDDFFEIEIRRTGEILHFDKNKTTDRQRVEFLRRLYEKWPDGIRGSAGMRKINRPDLKNPFQLFKNSKHGRRAYEALISSDGSGVYTLKDREALTDHPKSTPKQP